MIRPQHANQDTVMPPPIPPNLEKRSQKDVARWFRRLMAVAIVCGALSVGSVVGVMANSFAGDEQPRWITSKRFNPKTGQTEQIKTKTYEIDPWEIVTSLAGKHLDRKVNILVMGSDYNYSYGKRINDEEAGLPSRTDTMILVSLNPQTQKISMLNIPRDTRALLTGYHYDKINAAMTYGGVELAKSTVSDLTGVPIDYFMALKVDGLINIVDILGGIRIYVEKDMYYVDETAHLGINIHKGWKEAMNGEQANQYVRFRKDELGDIGRVQRQQKFIRAVMDKMMQPSSWLKIPELLKHLNKNITTDIPSDVIAQMVLFGKDIKKEDVKMVMLPGYFSSGTEVSYWLMDRTRGREVIADLFPDTTLKERYPYLTDNAPEDIRRYRVSVWNGTDDYEVGREIVRRLKVAGWRVWAVRKAPADAPKTQYIAQTGKDKLLKEVEASVGYRAEKINASTGDIATEFTVVIGEDMVKHMRKTMKDNQFAQYEYKPATPPPNAYTQRQAYERDYEPEPELPVRQNTPQRVRSQTPTHRQLPPAHQPVEEAPLPVAEPEPQSTPLPVDLDIDMALPDQDNSYQPSVNDPID